MMIMDLAIKAHSTISIIEIIFKVDLVLLLMIKFSWLTGKYIKLMYLIP